MKQLFYVFFSCIVFSVNAQEINYEHSIHHSFIENKGQWPNRVLFQSKLDGGNLWVEQGKFMYHLQDFTALHEAHIGRESTRESTNEELKQTFVHVNFIDANKVTDIEKEQASKQYYNYFLGNKKSRWTSNVRGYGEAILKDFYDGIDLKLIEQKRELKYEFIVAPNNSPSKINWSYAGHDKLEITDKGNLKVTTELGQIIEKKPYAYQIVNGRIDEVACSFHLQDSIVSFELGEYNPYAELVIDPVLVFATYCGSVTDNFGMTATYAYDGSAYSGGMIYGNAYPTPDPNAYNTTSTMTSADNPNYGITDAFLSKYSPDGTTMIWTTFIGGGNDTTGTETAHSIIADKDDNVYLYGATSSTDFPIQGGVQAVHNGGTANSNFYYNGVYFTEEGTDIYVAKISANGQDLMASTYLGGSANDGISYNVTSGFYNSVGAYDSLTYNYGDQFRGEIMLDSIGNCIIASCTRSTDFPTLNPIQANNAGQQDGVLFKLSSDLSTLQWSTYYGGADKDACYSVKVDSSQNVVFAGGTTSSDLLGTASGWQPTYNGGITDGFVGKLNMSGNTLLAASYVGTADYDQTFFVEIDRNDNVFLLGQSEGGLFPVLNAGYVDPGSSQFIAKLTPDLATLQNSTVFGNGDLTINISPAAFLVDICGNVYVSGWGANILQSAEMDNMPITPDAFQSTPPNGFDFYLFVLQREFDDILYGSYIGGGDAQEHVDGGTSRFDKNGVVYQSVCGGCGSLSDFPTTPNAWSAENLSNNCNNLVFKFDFQLIPSAEFYIDNNFGCTPLTVTFDNFSTESDSYLWDFGNGDTSTVIFNPTVTYTDTGLYEINLYVTDSICLLTDTATIEVLVTDSIQLTVNEDFELCNETEITMTANSNGSADNFVWSSSSDFSDTLNTSTTDSTLTTTPTEDTYYYVSASNEGCFSVDSVYVSFISSNIALTINDSICLGETTTAHVENLNPEINFTYDWSPDSIIVSGDGTETVTIQPQTSQYVYLTATSNLGCVVEDSIYISVGNIPDSIIAAYASDSIIPIGGEVELGAEPIGSEYDYYWTPPNLVDNPQAQTTTSALENNQWFKVGISDGVCTKYDSVFVQVFDFVCDDPFVYVPNSFTPNGDNVNDVLYVKGQMIEKMLFRIYNRWGELVFESRSTHVGWDGTFKDKPMDPDVYDYYLEVDCVGGLSDIIKGNVTLMK